MLLVKTMESGYKNIKMMANVLQIQLKEAGYI